MSGNITTRGISRWSVAGVAALTLLLAACGGRTPTATSAPVARSPVAANGGRAAGGSGSRLAAAGVPSGEFAGGVAGIVALINGTTLRVRLIDATVVSVEVSDSTQVRLLIAGSVGDLKVGDTVSVQGDKTGDTTYTATALTVFGGGTNANAGASGGQGSAARGTPASGTPRASATGGTSRGAGGAPAASGAPASGAPASSAQPGGAPAGGAPGGFPRGAAGGAGPNGTVPAGAGGGFPRGAANGTPGTGAGAQAAVVGTISALEDGKITLTGPMGTVVVTLGPTTTVHTQREGTFSDIRLNDIIVVQGDKTSEAVYAARLISDQGP